MKWRVAVHGVAAIVVLSCSSASQHVSASSQPITTLPPLEGLAKITVANEHKGGYNRSLFGENKDLDKDGCNTRAEVLERDSMQAVQKSGARCTVTSGKWLSPYDGRTWLLGRDVQIDHLVSLKEVWDSGGWAWSATQRSDYANELGNHIVLNVVTNSENVKKGEKDPSNYLPPLVSYRCTYLANWVAVKVQWKLSMDQSEYGRIKKLLQSCGTTTSTSTSSSTSTTLLRSRTSIASGEVAPVAAGSTAALLASIVVENEYTSGYVRELFPHWKDLDGNGCDTREEVLIRDSLTKAQVDPYGCVVVAGDWLSPYDAARWSDKGNVDIDHVVALKEAWDSGAWAWTTAQRTLYANDLSDPRTLLAVTDSVNQLKSDKDPSNWLPPLASYHCTYISDWVSIKARWKLSMDQSEYGRVKKLVDSCGTSGTSPTSSVTVPVTPPSVSSTVPSGVKYVSPGAYCSPIGAQGIAESKVSYLCATTSATGEPYANGRARWRKG
ncbi:MAG: HNH endonuclease family protein [Actinobacteria bacterium]|nr:HNH endonuclease family protein [Actinomycetota bacterium]